MSFHETLNRYNTVNTEARRLRAVLASRYGWDERKQMENLKQVLTRQYRTPPQPRPTVNGRPALRGEIF